MTLLLAPAAFGPRAPAVRMPWSFVAGVGGGIVDLAVAAAYWAKFDVDPIRIPQGIAAWLMGAEAYAGGLATAWLGLLAYCALMCGTCALYHGAAQRWTALRRHPVLCGSAYGVLAYGVIFWIAAPLLTGTGGSTRPGWIALCAVTYVVAIGIPAALAARTQLGGGRR